MRATDLRPYTVATASYNALVASVTVGTSTNPAPLIIIAVCAALSTAYVLLTIPRLRAAEEARRAARSTRRPRRPQPVEAASAAEEVRDSPINPA